MSVFRALVLHRAWIPAVVVATAVIFVPRAMEATSKMSRVSRAAGVYGSENVEANEVGGTRYRWMKRHAALHEPVRGRVLTVPLFIGRAGIETEPLTVRIAVAGVDTPPIVLQRRGWLMRTFDLVSLLGESKWKSLKTVTLSFEFEPAATNTADLSRDWGLPGIGLGDVQWSGPSPQ